jgi:integrase
MKRALPAYVYSYKTTLKSGPVDYIYFVKSGQRQRIKSEPGTPEFAAEYARLLRGMPARVQEFQFKKLIRSYQQSERFLRLAPRTKQDYIKVLNFLEEKIGHLEPAQMQRRHVIALQDANREKLRFANYCVQLLSVLFEHAIDQGVRKDNPAKGVRLIKSTSQPRQPWPIDLVNAYREVATGRASLIFELCVGTGQRIGNVLKMQWGQCDRNGISLRQGKTGRELYIPLTSRLRLVLDQTPRKGLSIVSGPDGRPLSYRAAADSVMKMRKQIGAEGYDIHSLRYTTAAELAALGLSDEVIMSITGHATVAMVARYAGPARQRQRAIEAQERRG